MSQGLTKLLPCLRILDMTKNIRSEKEYDKIKPTDETFHKIVMNRVSYK